MKSYLFIFLFFPQMLLACDFESALSYFQNEQWANAIELFKNCTKQESDIKAESYFYLGIIARNKNDLQTSIKMLENATHLNSLEIRYQVELAVSVERTGDHRKALQIYRKVLSKHHNKAAGMGEARMLHWMGEISDAISKYKLLIKRHPNDAGVKIGYGHVLLANYQKPAAIAQFQVVLKNEPNHLGALKGLEMAKAQVKHRFNISHGFENANGKKNYTNNLSFFSNFNHVFQWGFSLTESETPKDAPTQNGLPIYRGTLNSNSAFIKYNSTKDKSWVLGVGQQELVYGDQFTYNINHARRFNKKNQFIFGLTHTQSSIGESQLVQISWVHQLNKSEKLVSQYFFNHDSIFGNSQAFSFAASKFLSNKLFLKGGMSLSQDSNRQSWTAFLGSNFQVNKNWNIQLNSINNLSTGDHSLISGFQYQF